MDILDTIAVLAAVHADNPAEALRDKLGNLVEQGVEDAGGDGDALRRTLAGHLVCTILGMAADGLLDLRAFPDDVGEAVHAALIDSGQSPLLARLGSAVAAKALATVFTAQLGQVALMLCAATVALCPDESRHPDQAVMARCNGYLAHETVVATGTNELG